MKIKIISDGTAANTKIVNAETNEEIEGITYAKWEIRPGEFAIAYLEFQNVPVEVVAELKNTETENTCTGCGVLINADSDTCIVCKDRE